MGVLGIPVFNCGFADSCLVIIFFNLLGCMTVCLFSTLGPAFGLRQMVLSRFWFGWWGVKLSTWPLDFPIGGAFRGTTANSIPFSFEL